MRRHRLLSAWGALSIALMTACGNGRPPDTETALGSTALPVTVQKSFTTKIFVHMMPWFQVGGLHWSMNSRNGATGIASYYAPMIGEYNSGDANVIEYQLLLMKYAGIDGILVDWPGLAGANDLPQNKAHADAIIGKTAAFGLEFGIVYEDQYAGSVDAAKSDMAYVRDNFFPKANHLKVNGAPALLIFGPEKFTNAADWTNILSSLPSSTVYTLWYNNNAGSNAKGQFAWLAQNALKGVGDFDNFLDGVNHGFMIPVIYPGFNPYYAQGGWPGPTYKISYTLKTDNTEGGDTFRSTFDLGKYSGDPLQIATWNDYGEGTMIEPTNQFQYQFLTTLQQAVGAIYTDAELKIVKTLYDQRKQFGASKQAVLDQASAALANLDVASACAILGCTTPVHTTTAATTSTGSTGMGTTGSGGAAATTTTGAGRGGAGGATGATSTTGSGGHGGSGAGAMNMATTGSTSAGGATVTGTGGTENTAGNSGATPASNGLKGGCGCTVLGSKPSHPSGLLLAMSLFGLASIRRRRANA